MHHWLRGMDDPVLVSNAVLSAKTLPSRVQVSVRTEFWGDFRSVCSRLGYNEKLICLDFIPMAAPGLA